MTDMAAPRLGRARTVLGSTHARLMLATLGTAVAIYGQLLLTHERVAAFAKQPWVTWAHFETAALFPGALALLAAGVMIALALGPRAALAHDVAPPAERAWPRFVPPVLTILAVAIFAYVVVQLRNGNTETWLVAPWVVAMVVGAIAAAAIDRRRRVSIGLVVQPVEWGAILLAIGVVLWTHSRDLSATYTAIIGDEFSFYYNALGVARGDPLSIFSQRGVYEQHPVMSTVVQALAMRLFGLDHFGWKMGEVLVVCAMLPPTYFLARELTNRAAATVALAMMASSHYLMAYTHTGYNNLDAVPPVTTAALCAWIGVTRRSWFWIFLAGAAAGIAFYFFFSARIGIFLVIGTLVVLRPAWANVRLALPMLGGFVLAVTPLVVVNGWLVITAMLNQSITSRDRTLLGYISWIADHMFRSFVAFNYEPGAGRWHSIALADTLTGVAMFLGIVYCLVWLRWDRARFIAMWYVAALLVTGGLAYYQEIPETRLHVLLPFAVAAAGLIVEAVWRLATSTLPSGWNWQIHTGGLVAVCGLVLVLNLYRFWYQTPRLAPPAADSVAIEATFGPNCAGFPAPAAIVSESSELPRLALGSYALGARTPIAIQTPRDLATLLPYLADRCVVFSNLPPVRVAEFADLARAVAPELRVLRERDVSGEREVTVFVNRGPTETVPASSPAMRLLRIYGAGGGLDTPGRFTTPRDVALDGEGNLYVADAGNRRLQSLTRTGEVRFIHAIGSAGAKDAAPTAVAVGVDEVAVLEYPTGAVFFFGLDGSPRGQIATASGVRSMAYDSDGALWLVDTPRRRLLKLDREHQPAGEIALSNGSLAVETPGDLAIATDGSLWVLDGERGRLVRVDQAAGVQTGWTLPTRGGIVGPRLAIDQRGHLIVTATSDRQLLVYDQQGSLLETYGVDEALGFRPEVMVGIATAPDNTIFIADHLQNVILNVALER